MMDRDELRRVCQGCYAGGLAWTDCDDAAGYAEGKDVARAVLDILSADDAAMVGRRWLSELDRMTDEQVGAAYRAVTMYWAQRMHDAATGDVDVRRSLAEAMEADDE